MRYSVLCVTRHALPFHMAMAHQVNIHQLLDVSALSLLDMENPLSSDQLSFLSKLTLQLFLDYINIHYLLLYQIDQGNFAGLSVNYYARLQVPAPSLYNHYSPPDVNVRLLSINWQYDSPSQDL